MSTSTLNLDEVRGSFPALKSDQIFLDNAGGSQVLGTVVDRIRDYLINSNVQIGASYPVGKASTNRFREGYAAAAKYINASPEEIVLGASTTQLFRNLSSALTFQEGDELVLSTLDHEANIASWVDLAERQKLVVKWWGVADAPGSSTNPKLTLDTLRPLLGPRTRLVACTHASNILGTIHDVKAIAEAAHAHDPHVLVCVDAVAYAPHRKIDVKDLGVDFYCFSWYKVYGPHISQLYASPNGRAQVRSLGHFFNPSNTLQEKLGLAGSCYELVSSLPAVPEYLTGKWDGIVQQETVLQETLLQFLTSRKDVTIWGEPRSDPSLRVPTISFTVAGWSSRELVETVEKETNLGFRYGSFYSVRLIKDVLGLSIEDGIVRTSMVHYNTVDEVKALVAGLDKALSQKK